MSSRVRAPGHRWRCRRESPAGVARVRALLLFSGIVVAFAVSAPREARAAAADDAAGQQTAQGVLNDEYAQASYAAAQKKLNAALDRCKKGCSGATKAQLHIVLGMIASQLGKADEARNEFATAIADDGGAKLPDKGTSPSIKTQWQEARELAGKRPDPSVAAPASTNVNGAAAPVVPKGNPKIGGWVNPEAFELASAGLAADVAGRLEDCVEKDRESLKLEESPRTRLHLASCETRSGKLVDALRDASQALQIGRQRNDEPLMRAARTRIEDLIPRIPHVTFVPPPGKDIKNLHVTFDERDVPVGSLTKRFSIDPGKHHVHADAEQNGVPVNFDEDYDVKERELLTVKLALHVDVSDPVKNRLPCILDAKTDEELRRCIEQRGSKPRVKLAADLSGYADTYSGGSGGHVYILSPGIDANVESPTQGWNVGGTFLIDVVSAASPDIVSEASRRYNEKRYAASVAGGYKPKWIGANASAFVSSEPDYLSVGAGGAVTADLNDKLIAPRLGYTFSHDTIGRGATPFAVFSKTFITHEIEASSTFILSPTSLVVVGLTMQFERGDQSKPYRFVPMFDPDIAPRIPVGAPIDIVNTYRLPVRPLEQLPTERDRYAIAARFNKRFPTATLRLEERIYTDTWGTKASSTDARYIVDVFDRRMRIWPHVRFHAQSGTSFYQRAYSALVDTTDPANPLVRLPTYRTDDRELSPMLTITGGGGAHIGLTSPEADTQWGLTFQGDLMYSRFLNSLFVTARTAVYGSMALDVEFD